MMLLGVKKLNFLQWIFPFVSTPPPPQKKKKEKKVETKLWSGGN
jgi:hypothetical protein